MKHASLSHRQRPIGHCLIIGVAQYFLVGTRICALLVSVPESRHSRNQPDASFVVETQGNHCEYRTVSA